MFNYPNKFVYEDSFSEDKITMDRNLWLKARGFFPSNPLIYQNSLVIELFDECNNFLTYQLRDLSTDDTETKYRLVKSIFNSYVKTDTLDIPGDKVLVEGTIDCVLLRAMGINAYTTLGLKKGRFERIFRELNESFTFIPDNDLAGLGAVTKVKRRAIVIYIPTQYKDINTFFTQDSDRFYSFIDKLKQLQAVTN